MKATWRDRTIAESAETREVGGYVYFPREAVEMARLRLHPRNASDLECPNGVQFYDVVGEDGTVSERAAWSYEKPGASMKQVDHWVSFWNDVTIA